MLVLVVGPSGAGKDTLLAVAKAALSEDRRFRFIRRDVTRQPRCELDNEEAVDEPTFHARRDEGAYAFWWHAHGLFYGVPADLTHDVAASRVVVASVSRTVLAVAAARFPVRVVEITAPRDVLAHRLAARGREDAAQITGRLSRSIALPEGLTREVIVNDGTVEQGACALLDHLYALAGKARRTAPAREREQQP